MRIAIPIVDGGLSMHFGHCREFALVDVDVQQKCVLKMETVEAPAHEPGLLPRWLAEKDVNVVIAGGMGGRAQQLFSAEGIQVAVGAPAADPETLAMAYVNETLETGPNVCDH